MSSASVAEQKPATVIVRIKVERADVDGAKVICCVNWKVGPLDQRYESFDIADMRHSGHTSDDILLAEEMLIRKFFVSGLSDVKRLDPKLEYRNMNNDTREFCISRGHLTAAICHPVDRQLICDRAAALNIQVPRWFSELFEDQQ